MKKYKLTDEHKKEFAKIKKKWIKATPLPYGR